MSKNNLNLLIAGSQRFDDDRFVYGILDTFYAKFQGHIDTIFTGKYAGACQFAQSWIEEKNSNSDNKIANKDYTFDMDLAKNNRSFYEEADIPDFLIQEDPFFQKGKEYLIEKQVKLIFIFPNPEGIIGPSTKNILRFAELANVKHFDCTEAYQLIKKTREKELMNTAPAEKGFLKNQYGMKKF